VPTEVRLRDGSRAIVWSLLPGDREALREAYEHLSPESRFHRFLAPVPHLTEDMLVHLVDEVDGVDHVARVLFVLEDQGRGVATALLAEMLPKRPAGVTRIVTEVAADNDASLAMLRRLGSITMERAGVNRMHVTVELPPSCQSDAAP
jgi:RimJ/RimL family protein N-acetyltransferase